MKPDLFSIGPLTIHGYGLMIGIDPYRYEQNLEFEELMSALDEKYRVILTLYYVEGFNTREIAEILEIAENTVKTRLVRGRKQFSREYGFGEGRSMNEKKVF